MLPGNLSKFVLFEYAQILKEKTRKFQNNLMTVESYSETLNNEYIVRIHQMSYSSLSDNGMLQIFSLLIK